jgi:type I restriction enzyme S subunit
MSKINNLIKEMCPNGVEFKKLEDCCNILDNKRKPISKGIREMGEYPYYGANGIQDYISDYIFDGKYVLVGEDGSVQTPNGTPIVNWAIGKIWVNNHAHIIEEIDGVSLRYLYHYLQIVDVKDLIHGNIPKLNQSNFRNIKIAVPPLEVQEEIVKILDKFGELEAELEAELETRKNQYEFWRGTIISNSNGKDGKLIELLSGPITDGPHTTPKFVSEGIPFISASAVHEGKIHLKDAQGFITKAFDNECSRKYKPRKWDVYMVKSGSTTGKVAIVDIDADFNIWSPLAAMRTDNEITSRYLYHLLQTKDVQEQVRNRMSHGSQPNLSMRVLEQFDIKIPTLEEQHCIVNILDKFDKLINDISKGLPAEIELRRKQYEYYRNKLLSFEVCNDE